MGSLTEQMMRWAAPRRVGAVQMYAEHARGLSAPARSTLEEAYRHFSAIAIQFVSLLSANEVSLERSRAWLATAAPPSPNACTATRSGPPSLREPRLWTASSTKLSRT